MTINFPNSPSLNQLYTYDNKTWEWNGIYWEVYSALTSYITSAYTVGDGFSDISGVTGGNIVLKSFSGVNINIIDSGNKLTFSGYPQQNITGLYLPISGGTVTGSTNFTNGLTATTISATTYQNLPLDIFVTGGTYLDGTATFTNTTGGTFNVSGFFTQDIYWTSGSSGNFSIKANNNSGLDALNDYSVAEGFATQSNGFASHSEGFQTTANGDYSHVEGTQTTANGIASHSEGSATQANGDYSHAEGYETESNASYAHAEGIQTRVRGEGAHAEGFQTTADGDYSHTEGISTRAEGDSAHAEGTLTIASGRRAHAEGLSTRASGSNSHAEGSETMASGENSHSQGLQTTASGDNSFAGGKNTIASGGTSFVFGTNSRAIAESSIVLGDNLTGTSSNTVYTSKLNVKFLSGGTAVRTVGVDTDGFLVNDNEFDFSLNFIDDFTYPIILPYNWVVDTVDDPSSIGYSLSTTGGTYSLGNNISAFTETLTVSASTSGFINLNCRKLG